MHYLKWSGVALALSIVAALALPMAAVFAAFGGRGASPPAAANPFAQPLWDDGKAEFSVYTGTTQRYGETRATEARMVVVKEDLVRSTLVKSDSGPIPGKTVEAIKLNFSADFVTGTYTYHQNAGVFFERRSLEVLKENMSHTELCGITFVRVGPKQGQLVHEAHSYWDGEADRVVPVVWPAGPHAFADALPVWLRQFVAGGRTPFEIKLWLLPSQISGRSPIESARPTQVTIRMMDGGPLAVPAGKFGTRRFAVTTAAGSDLYWFDEKFPHALLMMETLAGRKLVLKKTLRLDYWNHHSNGDELLLD